MVIPDVVNGLFEIGMGVFGFLSVLAIRKHKTIKGVHWGPTAIAGLWGLWNLYYYPYLGQWFSLIASLGIVLINSTWLGHAWHYHRVNARQNDVVNRPFYSVSVTKQ